jgi:hypothetical protein
MTSLLPASGRLLRLSGTAAPLGWGRERAGSGQGAEEGEEDREETQAEEQARQHEREVDAEVVHDEDARPRPSQHSNPCRPAARASSVCLSVCLAVRLAVCPSVRLAFAPSAWLPHSVWRCRVWHGDGLRGDGVAAHARAALC